MEDTKKVYSYDDTLKSFRFGVDYSKSKEDTVEEMENLKYEITEESKQGIEYVSNAEGEIKSQRFEEASPYLENFKSFVAGVMFGCSVVIVISHFLYKILN